MSENCPGVSKLATCALNFDWLTGLSFMSKIDSFVFFWGGGGGGGGDTQMKTAVLMLRGKRAIVFI